MLRTPHALRGASFVLLLTACSGSEGDPDEQTDGDASAIQGSATLEAGAAADASAADAGASDASAPRDAATTRDASTSGDGAVSRDAGGVMDGSTSADASSRDSGDARSDASLSDAAQPDAARPDAATGGDGGAPAFERAFHIPLRVHRGDSGLTPAAIASILEEVNQIWWKQAAICFEVEVSSDAQLRSDGFDFFFHRSMLGCGADANGVYCGDHDIHSLDAPSLSPVDNAIWDTRQNPARTTAHELGHGLRLEHYNGFPDSNDSLMSSGRQGFKLHDSEISTARARAQMKALPDSSSAPCAPVPGG